MKAHAPQLTFEQYREQAKTLADNALRCLADDTCGDGRGAYPCAYCLEREARARARATSSTTR